MILAQSTEMPPPIYEVASKRSCPDSGSFIIQAPHLAVKSRFEGDSLMVDVELISRVATTAGATSVKAFISVDGVPIILYLPAGGTVSLAFPRVTAGGHSLHYGVFKGDEFYQNLCISV